MRAPALGVAEYVVNMCAPAWGGRRHAEFFCFLCSECCILFFSELGTAYAVKSCAREHERDMQSVFVYVLEHEGDMQSFFVSELGTGFWVHLGPIGSRYQDSRDEGTMGRGNPKGLLTHLCGGGRARRHDLHGIWLGQSASVDQNNASPMFWPVQARVSDPDTAPEAYTTEAMVASSGSASHSISKHGRSFSKHRLGCLQKEHEAENEWNS